MFHLSPNCSLQDELSQEEEKVIIFQIMIDSDEDAYECLCTSDDMFGDKKRLES